MTDMTDYMYATFTLDDGVSHGIPVCPIWDNTDCGKLAAEIAYEVRSILAFNDRTQYEAINELIDFLYANKNFPLNCRMILSVTRPNGTELTHSVYATYHFVIDKGFFGGRKMISFKEIK